MKAYSVFFSTLILLSGCGGAGNHSTVDSTAYSEKAISVSESLAVEETAEAFPSPKRKLIKEGNVSFETDDLSDTRQKIEAALQQHKGYIASEQEYKSSGSISQSLQIRVPVANFEKFVDDISRGIPKFDNKSINSRDITTEFIDISARIKTKKELENRYLDLLKKANSVKDILEIEKEIGALRAEIESIEGRLRYLGDQSDYSSLNITYYKNIPKQYRTAFGNKFSEGFVNGWYNLVWFFVGLVNIWPFVLIIGALIFWCIRWIRNRRNNIKIQQ